jgi:hypothetical protein
MYRVVNGATVSDVAPKNGDGYLMINPNPVPDGLGYFSALVTGWSKPDRFSWDIVPNLLVKGTLYNADSGVEMLITNLANNPLIGTVYFMSVTPYDRVSGSCKVAFDRLVDLGYDCYICYRDYPEDNCRVSQATNHHRALLKRVIQDGKHCPERGFTYLTNQVVSIGGFSSPDYHAYFEQWFTEDVGEDVKYTYGSRIVPQIDSLVGGERFSTQRVISLLNGETVEVGQPAGMPCLTQLSYFEGELTAIFRSHDIGNAWLMNVEALMYCHHKWFDIPQSERKLTVISLNAHVYDWFDRSVVSGFVPDDVGYFYFRGQSGNYEIYLNDRLVGVVKTKQSIRRWLAKNYPNLGTSHVFWLDNEINTI